MTARDPTARHASRPIIVTGGGTAGHVLPALAIMDRLAARGHDPGELHYVGTQQGIERRLLPPTGYDHTLLDVVGFQRSFSRRNLAFVPKLLRSTWQARRLLRTVRPSAVVNVGGYASVPASFAARLQRVPIVVVSFDRRPGQASKLAARFAAASATAFAGSTLPRARHTGAPIRRELIEMDRVAEREAARDALGLPLDRFVVSVFGGSLGARAINHAIADLVERSATNTRLAIYHVVGDRWLADMSPAHTDPDGIMYRVIGYEERMRQVYAASDLLVVRAGASTVAEVAATGTPAIFVPWPGAAENHQLDNARTLTDIGAGVLVEESAMSGARLLAEIERLDADPAALAAIAAAARAAGEIHRGDSLIDLIDEVAAR